MSRPTAERMAQFRKMTPRGQCAAVESMLRGEESEYFAETINRLVGVWDAMPTSYQTDGQGKEAVAKLHYFTGGCDWWIVEKDIDTDGEGQIQAFGVADLGQGYRELGYINLVEILAAGAELDFHYTPKTVGEIMKGA